MTSTRAPGRLLAWEGCLNARDLGGYPSTYGGETRWGAVVRSDSLTLLTEAGRAALVGHGVRTIIDLRRSHEIHEHPNPFADGGPDGVAYTNIPFQDPAAPDDDEPETLAVLYVKMLDQFRSRVAAVLTAIAQASLGGVLVHCMAGKDRTGLVSALLLDVAGIERETVAADYALSAEYLSAREEEFIVHGPGERAERERLVAKYSPRAEVMLETLARVDEHYGGVEQYLMLAGVSSDDVARLRRRLLAAPARR